MRSNFCFFQIEFIDLSDVEEQERLCILNFLRTWDANVEVPWKKPNHYGKTTGKLHNYGMYFCYGQLMFL